MARGAAAPDSHKSPVVALVQRDGRIRAFPMPRVTADNLRSAVHAHAEREATIMTDDFFAYRNVGETMGGHEAVKHSAGTSGQLAKAEREAWKRAWGPRQLKFKLGL